MKWMRCPRCGVATPIKKLKEAKDIGFCLECGLLVIQYRKRDAGKIKEVVLSLFQSNSPALKDLRETKVFAVQAEVGYATLFFIEESMEIHPYNECMDCGKPIKGAIYKDYETAPNQVLYLCEDCANRRERSSFGTLF